MKVEACCALFCFALVFFILPRVVTLLALCSKGTAAVVVALVVALLLCLSSFFLAYNFFFLNDDERERHFCWLLHTIACLQSKVLLMMIIIFTLCVSLCALCIIDQYRHSLNNKYK